MHSGEGSHLSVGPPGLGAQSGSSRPVAVLGAGLAGLAAAQALAHAGLTVAVYEKNRWVGGHASSHHVDGFVFDEGPHVSFTKVQEVRDLLASGVGQEFFEHEAEVINFWRGVQLPHPAQCHLHGLPVDVVERCLVDFVRRPAPPADGLRTYEEWCVCSLGRAFSEEMTFPYTRKYWTAEAAQLTADWVGSRVHAPTLEQVVRGALASVKPEWHYITRFRYPHRGGFGAYARAVLPEAPIHLDHELIAVDPRRRRLTFANGTEAEYDTLISSLPLPELVRRIREVPADVAEAAETLCCTSVVLVNVGVERAEGFPPGHWSYVYDEDLLSTRIHYPHRLSPHNAPEGCGSVQVEVYHSPYRPLACADVLGRVIEELHTLKVLRRGDRIRVAQEQRVKYANVLFDHARRRSLEVVQGYLEAQGIVCCGRYGEWAYYWSDDSILSGRRAAERALGLRRQAG